AGGIELHGVGRAGMGPDLGHRLALGGVPYAQRAICAGAGDDIALGIESDAVNRAGMAGHVEEQLAVSWVPELDRAVLTGAGKQLAVGSQGQAVDGVGVDEFAEVAADWYDPDFGGVVRTAGGGHLAIPAQAPR